MKRFSPIIFSMFVGFSPISQATVLFQDTFQTDLSQWTTNYGEIAVAPDGSNALTFSNPTAYGDLLSNNVFNSSTGSFTLSFDVLGNCGATSGCGGFVQATNTGWILSDSPFRGIAQFPDGTNWVQVSYTFSGNSTGLGFEIWNGAPNAQPQSVFFQNLVLTDNPTANAIGNLSITPVVPAVPVPAALPLFASALLGFVGLNMRKSRPSLAA